MDYIGKPITIQLFGKDLLMHPEYHKSMFDIIGSNMNSIISQPDFDSDEAYRVYYDNRIYNTSMNNVNTALAFDGETVCGFMQFSFDLNQDTATWQEMQIKDRYQGDGKTFPALLSTFFQHPDSYKVKLIYGYINHKNIKSQSVFTGIGFHICEITASGAKYSCAMQDARNWFITRYSI